MAPGKKKLKAAPLRCKCGDNILHVGSKLLMYTARKAGVSPFKSGYLGGTELMAAAVIKGPRPSRLLSSGDGRLVDMQRSGRVFPTGCLRGYRSAGAAIEHL